MRAQAGEIIRAYLFISFLMMITVSSRVEGCSTRGGITPAENSAGIRNSSHKGKHIAISEYIEL